MHKRKKYENDNRFLIRNDASYEAEEQDLWSTDRKYFKILDSEKKFQNWSHNKDFFSHTKDEKKSSLTELYHKKQAGKWSHMEVWIYKIDWRAEGIYMTTYKAFLKIIWMSSRD